MSMETFLMDREAGNLSPKSVQFYRQKLTIFLRFLADRGVSEVGDMKPNDIRAFLVSLKAAHTPGGVHAYFRAIKVFCKWLFAEGDVSSDLMGRIKAPRVPLELLEPVNDQTVAAMLKACAAEGQIGARDYALILMLLDTGLRASELLAVNVSDVDLTSGRVRVRKTKNGKQRVAFLGEQTRAALSCYLVGREDAPTSPLFATREGSRLRYTGLRDILRRRAKVADIKAPTLHAFRRSFALNCLRAGMDIYSLQQLMGHSDLSVLRRYLAQTEDDLRDAHLHASPVDGRLHAREWAA